MEQEIIKSDKFYNLKKWGLVLGFILAIVPHFLDFNLIKSDKEDERHDIYVEKYVNCQEEILIIKNQVTKLAVIIATSNLLPNDIPVVLWRRDREGYITYVSDLYVTDILHPLNLSREDIIGTKGECFGKEISKDLLENSLLIMNKDKRMRFNEYIPRIGMGVSIKAPSHDLEGRVIGSIGVWIPNAIQK